ncbi:MAG: hypothetical protein WC975_01750 [Phycisphaerae bacterium]
MKTTPKKMKAEASYVRRMVPVLRVHPPFLSTNVSNRRVNLPKRQNDPPLNTPSRSCLLKKRLGFPFSSTRTINVSPARITGVIMSVLIERPSEQN